MYDNSLWEILVPTVRNDGRPIKTRFHRVWDKKVRDITSGLTIMAATKGQWVGPSGKLFLERMIPVRIVASREQINEVINMTVEYYEQEAVLCYALSHEVILAYNQNKVSKPDIRFCQTCTKTMTFVANLDNQPVYTCYKCNDKKFVL